MISRKKAYAAAGVLIVALAVIATNEYRHGGTYLLEHRNPVDGDGIQQALGQHPAAGGVRLLERHAAPGLDWTRPNHTEINNSGWTYGWRTSDGKTCVVRFSLTTDLASTQCYPPAAGGSVAAPQLGVGGAFGCTIITIYGVTSPPVTSVELVDTNRTTTSPVVPLDAYGMPTSYAFAVSFPVDSRTGDVDERGVDTAGNTIVTRAFDMTYYRSPARRC